VKRALARPELSASENEADPAAGTIACSLGQRSLGEDRNLASTKNAPFNIVAACCHTCCYISRAQSRRPEHLPGTSHS